MSRGFYWTANAKYLRPMWVRVRRAPRAPALGNVESGFIDLDVNGRTYRNANWAYMVYECLTNDDWGMGQLASQIDTDSFLAAAQLARDENFGLFMTWVQSDTVENFVGDILDHALAALFISPKTGKWTVKPFRGDYAVEDLPLYTPEDAVFEDFDRKLPGETINEIVVTWTNPVTEKEETVTMQDLANVVSQGGQIVSQPRNYHGIRSSDLALQVCARDLRAACTPLARCTMKALRQAWDETPGNCIRVTIPEEDVEDLVMRVQNVDYGSRSDAYVTISLIEDVFGLDAPALSSTTGTDWQPVAIQPNPPAFVKTFTAPAYMVANAQNLLAEPLVNYEVIAGVLAADTNQDFLSIEPYTNVTLTTGDVVKRSIGTRARVAHWRNQSTVLAEVSTTFVGGFPGRDGNPPQLGDLVFIGGTTDANTEIALVQAINAAGDYTLARGVLDTLPRAWPVNTNFWFVGAQAVLDPTIRAAGETVSYRPLMRTSVGLLAYTYGQDSTLTLTNRPHLPLRPTRVLFSGNMGSGGGFGSTLLFPASNGSTTVSWNNRNRLTETSRILGWDAASVTQEPGQTTLLEVLDSSMSVLKSYSVAFGLNSQIIPFSDLAGGTYIRISAVRDGLFSLTRQTFAYFIYG